VFMISHRLSTLGQVDEILVMRAGEIVERGTFKELKRKKGVFADLLAEQNRYNLDRVDDAVSVQTLYKSTAPLVSVLPRSLSSHAKSKTDTLSPLPVPGFDMRNDTHFTRSNGHSNGHAEQEGKKPTKARILVEMDGKTTGEYQLNKPIFTIGRFPGSDIQILSERVSRFHALLWWRDGAWIIKDEGSLNGLSHDDMRIDELTLTHKDRIYLDPEIMLQYEELPE